jgi:hypothetical protein
MSNQINATALLSARDRWRRGPKRKRAEDRLSVCLHCTVTERLALELEEVVEHLRSQGANISLAYVIRAAVAKYVGDYRKNNGLAA